MTKDEMLEEFKVIEFSAPYVVVVRKSDGVKGTLIFNHGTEDEPRVYRDFQEFN
jgi:hypothetical protein